jgi:hypothetical protein
MSFGLWCQRCGVGVSGVALCPVCELSARTEVDAATIGRLAGELWRVAEREAALIEALMFYAFPSTWFGVSLWPDQPCGAIVDDLGGTEELGRPTPGQLARETLAAIYAPEYWADTVARRPPDRSGQMADAEVDAAFGG